MTSLRKALFTGGVGLAALVLQACATTPPAPPATPVFATTAPCSGAHACVQACTAGQPRACTLAADRARLGTGTPRDVPFAERLYRRACEAHDGLGCAGLGWLTSGRPSQDAFARALPLLTAACTHEDAEACIAGGTLLLQERAPAPGGTSAGALLTRGVALLADACHRGEGAACVRAATLLDTGPEPVRNAPRALVLLQKACDAGVPGGCMALGVRSLSGHGLPRDRTRALAFFRQAGERYRAACDAGEAGACAELARSLARGEGVEADPARALAYAERACTLGDAPSCAEAARQLREGGAGVTVDATRAGALAAQGRQLRQESCDAGSGAACLELAADAPTAQQRPLRERACQLGRPEACTPG